ncbi:TonB-dependent receptor domain-containing protein [candidate division KSB1 bacterium]
MKRYFTIGLVVILSVFMLSNLAFAQRASFHGSVTDQESGERLIGANIQLTSSVRQTRGSATDNQGRFEITSIPPGEYTLVVSYIGYGKEIITDFAFEESESKTMDFELNPVPFVANQVTVTASRRQEKVLNAPASVTVLESEDITAREVLTPADNIIGLPGVDIARVGLGQGSIVMRGFNNVFSSTLMSIVDNRIARIPSLRVNVYNFIPTTNEDIERIEVVLGPASALYGPNTANGVMHMITKSPFGSEGNKISISGGERSVANVQFRHASSNDDNIGFKISGSYFRGNDWEYIDPAEVAARNAIIAVGGDPGKIAQRDYDMEKMSLEARLDIQPTDDLTLIFNSGFNNGNQIELTGLGAAQAVDWTYYYAQGRLMYKDFFFQTFLNTSDAGDTYLLNTGADIVDKSSLIVSQAQHNWKMNDWQNLTYGLDMLLTKPDTEGTINGRNEDDDDMTEIGFYMQSETKLHDKLKMVLAGRYDDHSQVKDPYFSPRAALVFEPKEGHTFRATFNSAFSTPSNNNMFLDLEQVRNFIPGMEYDIMVYGSRNGYTFDRTSSGLGGLYMQSPFYPTSSAYLPADATLMWSAAVGVLQAAGAIDAATAGLLNAIAPNSSQVGTALMLLNPTTGAYESTTSDFVQDIKPIESTKTNTFEFGYKGIYENKLLFTADIYHSRIRDFVGPLRVETPNVFLDPTTLGAYLGNFLPPANAAALTAGMASIPLATVTPENALDPYDLFLTYRNFGDINLTGADFSIGYFLNQNWNVSGYGSFVNKDYFTNSDWPSPIALNAPKKKFGASVEYKNYNRGFNCMLRFRHVDKFRVNSGVYIGDVDAYDLLDVNFGYKLPVDQDAKITLTIQNLFDNKHIEMVGAPKLGRLALLRLTFGF